MSTAAIVMMIVSLLVVWGGLVAAVINLRARPAVPDAELAEPTEADLAREPDARPHRDT